MQNSQSLLLFFFLTKNAWSFWAKRLDEKNKIGKRVERQLAKLESICLGNGKKRLQSASGYLNNPYKNSQTAPTTTHGRSNQQASAEMTPLRPQRVPNHCQLQWLLSRYALSQRVTIICCLSAGMALSFTLQEREVFVIFFPLLVRATGESQSPNCNLNYNIKNCTGTTRPSYGVPISHSVQEQYSGTNNPNFELERESDTRQSYLQTCKLAKGNANTIMLFMQFADIKAEHTHLAQTRVVRQYQQQSFFFFTQHAVVKAREAFSSDRWEKRKKRD